MKIDPITRMCLACGCIIGGFMSLMISQSIQCKIGTMCEQFQWGILPISGGIVILGIVIYCKTSSKSLMPVGDKN